MKNLATCKPSEFLRQANKIRKSVQKWLTLTDILSIREKMPELQTVTMGMPDDEKADALNENRRRIREQSMQNAMEILDAVMDKYPDETLELLGLLCFVEPEEVDNYPVGEYLQAFTELITDQAVLGFFTSLARLGQTDFSER